MGLLSKVGVPLVIGSVGFAGRAGAAPITIVNAGFEEPVTGGFTTTGAPGWTLNGTGGGVWRPETSPSVWTVTAPEGNQVGWLSPAQPPNAAASYFQAMSATLEADTRYTLAGWAGHPIGYGSSPDPDTTYTVELLAGSVVLASTTGTGPEGTFAPFAVTFESTGSPLVGQTLGVRLTSSKPQTGFDGIMLDATPVPSPGVAGVSAVAVVAASCLTRRRRG